MFLSALIIGALVLISACARTTVKPDYVVGIELECNIFFGSDHATVAASGDACLGKGTVQFTTAINQRQVLTIRTSEGRTYTVSVAADQSIKLGQTWPPD